MKYAISSCLMGKNCKYNGGNNNRQELVDMMQDKDYILVCPEVLGGLPTPRACCEKQEGRIMNTNGEDMSGYFIDGAQKAVKILKEHGVDIVITQSRSPSCGKGTIYDGTFQNYLISGNGVFVEMCIQNGFQVKDVNDFIKTHQKVANREMKTL